MKNLFLFGILLGSISLIGNTQAMNPAESSEENLENIVQIIPSKKRQKDSTRMMNVKNWFENRKTKVAQSNENKNPNQEESKK